MNLPRYLTPFIGRQAEVAEVRRLLADRRLVTLTGPGGSGKTRLALEVVVGLVDEFPEGFGWVELAELTEPALVPQAIAAALKIHESGGQAPKDALVNYLHTRQALLILDNCEHLIDACAILAIDLLQHCPDLHILATSREALGLPGEIVRPMLSLDLPIVNAPSDPAALAHVEAIALFVDRAVALAPDFRLTEANAQAISRICRLLEGMPLAIELAAARVSVLSVVQIAAHLEDSLRLLSAGPRLGLPRHRTMHAAIEWSYALLTEPEQILWRRLAVFRGPFSLAAAEAICSEHSKGKSERPEIKSEADSTRSIRNPSLSTDLLDLLSQLVQKSLVVVMRGEGEARYRLLEPLRQFAAEKLEAAGETAVIRQRHCDYYHSWAEQHEAKLRGPEQLACLRRFDTHYANLRAALAWSLEPGQRADLGLRLAAALGMFWLLSHAYTEGRRWLTEALERPDAQAPTLHRECTLYMTGVLAWFQGDYPASRRYSEESLAIARSLDYDGQWGIAYGLMLLGQTVRFQGQEEAARQYLIESIARFRRSGDRWGLAVSLDSLGSVYRQVGDLAAAYITLNESRGIWRTLDDPWGIALNQLEFFMQALAEEDDITAQSIFDEYRATFEMLGLSWHLCTLYQGIGNVALGQEEYAVAAERYRHSLELARQIGDNLKEAAALMALGAAVLGQDRLGEATLHGREGLLIYEQAMALDAAAFQLERMAGVAARTAQHELSSRLQALAAELRQAADLSPDALSNQAAVFANALAEFGQLAVLKTVGSKKAAGASFDLTARELEVLRLAAEGLTDPQIAGRLVLSKRTVSAHLQSVYSKLGVNSRTAAARLAFEHHLFD